MDIGSTADGVAPVVDLVFDSGMLHVLRAEVQVHARQAGMPEERAGDMVLAVNELASNVIRHGAGGGRLRMWYLGEALRCQVDDGDPPGQAMTNTLPEMPGHGLWVVRQVADRVQILSGQGGTRATISFYLP
jgi:anti-sigma regulatory factor (Ser/Thr protein kinase)